MEYVTPKEMRVLDLNSEYFGVPRSKLMENAGRGVCEVVEKKLGVAGENILILCGTGNNGGDGFVAAERLAEKGARVITIVLLGNEKEIRTEEARKNWNRVKKNKNITIVELGDVNFDDFDIIVDAILGTGIKGRLREPVKSVVERINASRAKKVSVDVPTGLNTETGEGRCVNADLVVTFHRAKKGLEGFNTFVKDIGIPKKAGEYVGIGDVIVNLPKRKEESHKGDNGRVLIVGGSDVYYGAPVLSGFGALNSGADLVFLAVPESNYDVSRVFSPDLIVREYKGEYLSLRGTDIVIELATECDVLVMGPGLGKKEETKKAVLEILQKIGIPVVIDADGIKALAENAGLLKKLNALITPHAGEFKMLTGRELPEDLKERKDIVLEQARKLGCPVLLKSSIDIVASPDGRIKLNETGNPGMSVGGTGDVLAGLAGSLIAQGMDIFEAGCCSAFINGAAGDELLEWKGYSYTAMDLASELPYTIKRVLNGGM